MEDDGCKEYILLHTTVLKRKTRALNHYSEDTLEKYVRSSSDIDARQRLELGDHAQKCRLCRDYVEYFTTFYDDYRALSSDAHSERIITNRFLNTLYALMPLKPLKIHNANPGNYRTVLAAVTSARYDNRYITVAIMIAEREKALVRIIMDMQERKHKLYVLTEDPARRAFAMISFPDISLNLVADNHGHVETELETEITNRDWSKVRGILRLPVDEFYIGQNILMGDIPNLEGKHGLYYAQFQRTVDRLVVSIEKYKSYAPQITYAVLHGEHGKEMVRISGNGRGIFTDHNLSEISTLMVYC